MGCKAQNVFGLGENEKTVPAASGETMTVTAERPGMLREGETVVPAERAKIKIQGEQNTTHAKAAQSPRWATAGNGTHRVASL